MRLFPQSRVDWYLELGWWSDSTWDSLLRTHARSRSDVEALVDPSNRSTFTDGSAGLAGAGKQDAFDAGGYYCSSDLFEYVDDSLALLRYRGRASDLIVRGGFNISPAEIENVLLGDRICAFVVPKGATPTLDELIAVFADHQVAKFKWPERLELIDALPRNPIGKVLHRALRERLTGNES